MVTTSNPEFARAIRMLRDWGQERKYHPVLKGFNYRLEGMQAAILRVKLKHLDRWTEARRSSAALYDSLLDHPSIVRPFVSAQVRHVYHLYTVAIANRDRVQQSLQADGISTAVHYPTPIHLLPAYADVRYRAGDFPHAEAAARSVLSLPMNPFIAPEQIHRVAARLRQAAALADNRS